MDYIEDDEQIEEKKNKKKDGLTFTTKLLLSIPVIIVVVILISIVVLIIKSVSSKNVENINVINNSNLISNNSDTKKEETIKSIEAQKAYGKEKYEVNPSIEKVDFPEAISSSKTCTIGNIEWIYSLDANGNAIDLCTYAKILPAIIEIPDNLDGHKLISIGTELDDKDLSNSIFKPLNNESKDKLKIITKIIVPEGVKYIHMRAFYEMTKLEEVILPDSIKYIGDEAFSHANNLSRINSDEDGKIIMPKYLDGYGTALFRDNEKIIYFEFPEQINYINESTFYGCSGFKDLIVSGQYKYILENAFCDNKIETLKLVAGVKYIDKCFKANTKLQDVKLPNTIVYIGDNTFEDDDNIKEFEYKGNLEYLGKNILKNTGLDINKFISVKQLQKVKN